MCAGGHSDTGPLEPLMCEAKSLSPVGGHWMIPSTDFNLKTNTQQSASPLQSNFQMLPAHNTHAGIKNVHRLFIRLCKMYENKEKNKKLNQK